MNAFLTKYQLHLAAFLSVIAYAILAYYLDRKEFYWLVFLYLTAFGAMIMLLQTQEYEKTFFKIGLAYRCIFWVATPALSQDFYRFIWDGQAVLSCLNPYQHRPDAIIDTLATFPNADFLYHKMGALSAAHFSNYPPINQLLFAIAAFIGGKSILVSTIVLRAFIILADIGIYYYGRKILTYFEMNTENIFWYFLNPLLIIEGTGNLHFEGVMLFFFVLGMYQIIRNNWLLAAIFIAISIAIKLLPLLLLPLFVRCFGFKKSMLFGAIVLGINALFFLPFVNATLISNYLETIGLWFTNFEFNASIYYLVRELGYYIKGYNIIHTVGQITPIITVVMLVGFAFSRKNKTIDGLLHNALLALSCYFFIATTVHPWYVINLLLISVFTKFKYPLVWSCAIILSYFAYSNNAYKENMLLIALEYLAVFGVLVYELVVVPRQTKGYQQAPTKVIKW